MRILLASESRGWSGGAAQTLLLALGLRERGHSVFLATVRDSELGRRADEHGLSFFHEKFLGDADLLSAWRLRSFILKNRIDILHAQHPKAHAVSLLARLLTGSRLKFLVTRRVSFPVSSHIFSRWKYTHKAINRYLAVSDGIRQVLMAGGVPSSRITVVYSGIDPSTFRVSPPPRLAQLREEIGLKKDLPVVIKAANFSEWKGQAIFLQAVAKLVNAKIPAQFILAGRDTDGPEAKKIIQELNVASHVRPLGFRTDVADLLSLSDVSVNASIAGEGLSGALRESLFLGVPSVASDVSGNRELVQEGITGKLVPPGNAEALAKAIEWSLTHREDAKRFALSGQTRVLNELTAARMVEKTEAIYRELLS